MLSRERINEIKDKLESAYWEYTKAVSAYRLMPELFKDKTPLDYRLYDKDAQDMAFNVLCVLREETAELRHMLHMLTDVIPDTGLNFIAIDSELYRTLEQISAVQRQLGEQIYDTIDNAERGDAEPRE